MYDRFEFFHQICFSWESRHFGVVKYTMCRLVNLEVFTARRILRIFLGTAFWDKLTPPIISAHAFRKRVSTADSEYTHTFSITHILFQSKIAARVDWFRMIKLIRFWSSISHCIGKIYTERWMWFGNLFSHNIGTRVQTTDVSTAGFRQIHSWFFNRKFQQ